MFSSLLNLKKKKFPGNFSDDIFPDKKWRREKFEVFSYT